MSAAEPQKKRRRQLLDRTQGSNSSVQTKPSRSVSSNRIDFTTSLLSDELVLHIFSFLSPSDLARCARVNSTWFRFANDELLWKPLFLHRFRNPWLQRPKMQRPAIASKRKRLESSHDYEESLSTWKSLYKVNHNWRSGNCRISHLDLDAKLLDTALAQFHRDILCIALSSPPRVEVWRMKNNRVPIKCGILQPSNDKNPISCIKLEAPGDAGSSPNNSFRLVAGYGNGGFSLWNLSISSANELCAKEVVIHIPNVRHHPNRSVVSIGISYPMLVLCTASMTLSFFCINLDNGPATNYLVYELQSPIQWSPIVTEIHKLKDQSDDYWRANVCFGMSIGVNAHTVGIQEFILSRNKIISSRHSTAFNENDIFFNDHSNTTFDHTEPITALAYSEPYIITAHANNTIKQYHVRSTAERLELAFTGTLYGHTCKVSALAIDAHAGRLVSGDRCGVKIWDMPSTDRREKSKSDAFHGYYGEISEPRQQRRRIHGSEFLVSIDSTMMQHSPVQDPPWDMRWLQFDRDKIVAIMRNEQERIEKFSVQIWSFADT